MYVSPDSKRANKLDVFNLGQYNIKPEIVKIPIFKYQYTVDVPVHV